MNTNHLKKSFDSVTPTDAQKKHMLETILEKSQSPITSSVSHYNHQKHKRILAIAASLVIIVSGSMTLQHITMHKAPPSNSPPLSAAPPATSESFITYENASYKLAQEPTVFAPENLIGPLAQIKTPEGMTDTIWELKGHDPLYVIVVEHLGLYYLCENIELSQ